MGHLNNYLLKDLTWPKYLKRDRTLVIDISSNIIWARKQQRNRMRTATQQERTHPHIGGSIKSDETSRPYSCSIFCAALARSPQVSRLSSTCHAVLLLPSARSYPYTRKTGRSRPRAPKEHKTGYKCLENGTTILLPFDFEKKKRLPLAKFPIE